LAIDPKIGLNDPLINNALKAWISQTGSSTMVCGLIGPGTSQQITAKYSEPFANSSLGSLPWNEKTSALTQYKTGATSITALNTVLIWEGNEPYVFTLGLIFYAISNAYLEVMRPLAELEKWMAPDVSQLSPVDITKLFSSENATGRIPKTVTINIGRKLLIKDCVIESMTTPLDKERDKDGNLLRAEIQLQIKTQRMQTQQDVNSRLRGE